MDNITFVAIFAEKPFPVMKLRDGFSGERSLVFPRVIIEMMLADPVLSALHITDIGYYPRALGHYRERTEPIPQFVLIYCTHGKGWFETAAGRHEVTENTYFILPAGAPHKYAADRDEPWTIYWIHFSGTMAPHYATDTGVAVAIKPGVDSRIHQRIGLFEEMFTTLNGGFGLDRIRYAMSLFHHYLGSLRYLGEYRAGAPAAQADIIGATIHYMEENLERSLTLTDIATYSGLSRSYLSSSFKARTGHAPLTYFNLLKIRYACRLLDDTDMKVNSLCHKVGISDPYYFTRLFTKIMGATPTAYRLRKRT